MYFQTGFIHFSKVLCFYGLYFLTVNHTFFHFLLSWSFRLTQYACSTSPRHLCSRELTFKKGDAVNIIRQIDNNWYEGEHRGRVGIFPIAYVEVNLHLFCASFSSCIDRLSRASSPCLHPFSHCCRRCHRRRSISQSVLLLQHTSGRLARLWRAITSMLTLTWSCL